MGRRQWLPCPWRAAPVAVLAAGKAGHIALVRAGLWAARICRLQALCCGPGAWGAWQVGACTERLAQHQGRLVGSLAPNMRQQPPEVAAPSLAGGAQSGFCLAQHSIAWQPIKCSLTAREAGSQSGLQRTCGVVCCTRAVCRSMRAGRRTGFPPLGATWRTALGRCLQSACV